MAEFDELGALMDESDHLFGEISGLVGKDNFDEFVATKFKEFDSALPDIYKGKFSNPRIEDGELILKDAKTGKEINMSKFKNDFSFGDFEGGLKELGFDTKTAEARDFIKQRTTEYAQTISGVFKDSFQALKDFSERVDLPEPKDSADFDKNCKDKGWDISGAEKDLADIKKAGTDPKDPTVQKKVKDFLDKWGGELKKFLKNNWLSLLLLTAIILAAVDLYDFIKRMQHALSGCWSTMADASSSPCKINALTCSDDDLDDQGVGDGFRICKACQTTTCKGVGGGDWVPLRASVARTCDPSGKADFPGCYYPLADTGNTICTTPFQDKCTGGVGSYACPNTTGCIARKEACMGDLGKGDCSAWCDSSLLMPIAGQAISCKKCDFWCAANATLGQVFTLPSGLLGQIEKILLWIALGIVILVVVFVVGKELLHLAVSGSDKGKGGQDSNVNIKIASANASFGWKKK